jgi:hypothetical protein
MSSNSSNALARAARRAITSEFFLAGILHEYQQVHHLDDESLANLLECDIHDLQRLALCRRPAANQISFVHDIDHLAQRFHLRADQLAAIIRQVDSLRILRQQATTTQSAQGMLRAARDRDDSSADITEDADD